MKMYIAILMLAAAFIAVSYADECQLFAEEGNCQANNCFWCEKCGTAIYEQINSYGTDKCVASSIQCAYACSTVCGAQCSSDVNCPTILNNTDCYYSGTCSSCSCVYQQQSCPRPGAVSAGVCYYGQRLCTSNGCFVNKCNLKANEVCDPDNGCVSCGQANCGNSGQYVYDYKCSGDDLLAKQISYFCDASECLYNKTEILAEKCENGCNNGLCREELCNVEGVLKDCNEFDGTYGKSCVGNDVYASYRDYSCVSNSCEYAVRQVKQTTCEECRNGVCVDTTTVYTNNTPICYEGETQSAVCPDGSPYVTYDCTIDVWHARNYLVNPCLYQGSISITRTGNRLYNGLLFGSNEIVLGTRGGSGYVNFTVTDTNSIGRLVIEADSRVIFNLKAKPGGYSVPFSKTGQLRIYTTSSGWLFFVPSVYDVRSVLAQLEEI